MQTYPTNRFLHKKKNAKIYSSYCFNEQRTRTEENKRSKQVDMTILISFLPKDHFQGWRWAYCITAFITSLLSYLIQSILILMENVKIFEDCAGKET